MKRDKRIKMARLSVVMNTTTNDGMDGTTHQNLPFVGRWGRWSSKRMNANTHAMWRVRSRSVGRWEGTPKTTDVTNTPVWVRYHLVLVEGKRKG